ncbi:hypothetical protein HOY80DRAFT_997044 [Tuber brumale]|nr:hypothetical protein HOY80DRAFT_997044 [Tuber brumale]
MMVQWLEESENLSKMKKVSSIAKKQMVKEIATKIPTKAAIKVGYTYDNLLKSYREVAKLNNQSEKLLSRCPFFFRLEDPFGNHPNIYPPAQYDSGSNPKEAELAVKQLLTAMDCSSTEEEREKVREEEEGFWGGEEEGCNIGGGGHDGLVREEVDGTEMEEDADVTLKAGEKRRAPQWLDNEEDEDIGNMSGRSTRKKRSNGGVLVDAGTILASAKSDGEEKKFEFLNRHLIEQGNLRREELELE